MSIHFTGLSLGAPMGDPRLDLCDLYVFQSPKDPARTALILNANPKGDALHPDAVYRIAIDNDGDLRTDIAFNFVFSEPVDGRQKVDVYLALESEARVPAAAGSRIFGDMDVSFDTPPKVWQSGSFTFFAGARSDASFVDLEGDGQDSKAMSNVISMAIELPTSYLGAEPDVRIWGRCSLLRDDEWFHADRVAHPSLGEFFTDESTREEYSAGEPNQDRARWMAQFIDVLARTGGYTRDEAIDAIETEGTLPDMLTYNPSKPAKYPNGRTLTDDVIDYRLAFLTKGKRPPSKLSPHTDLLSEFPYLGPPH